jgi:transcriptional regulator with XRE-family HTH domain
MTMSNKIHFSQWLQGEMRKRGWTQAKLGRAASLKKDGISKLINGRCQPEPATLQAISRALDIPVETSYRAAGLLPPLTETGYDETAEQVIYLFRKIKDPRRRKIAVKMLRVLARDEAGTER